MSFSAIRQMLQEGDAFGFVSYDNGDITKNIHKFPVLKNINELLSSDFEDNLHNLLYKIMCKAFISNNT
jgi:hypothetical protein